MNNIPFQTSNAVVDPDHLADLRKSGLNHSTILEAGIYSVRPGDIGKKLGYNNPTIESLLSIPYPNCNGFERYKPFPVVPSHPKYLQKKDSGNHLFVPNQTLAKLKDQSFSDEPLFITEGEKKCLAGVQAGLTIIGLSGLWNWSNGNKELIPDFDQIVFQGRQVFIVPDSDWLDLNRHGYEKNLKEAVHELACRLIERGANVFVVELPQGVNEKVGLDDYLCNHTVEEFRALPIKEIRKMTLNELIGQATFENIKTVLRAISKLKLESEQEVYIARLSRKLGVSKKALDKDLKAIRAKSGQSGEQGIDELDQTDIIHSSIDFYNDIVFLGFRITGVEKDSLLTIVSGPDGVNFSMDESELVIEEKAFRLNPKTTGPLLGESWSVTALKSFRDDPSPPDGLFLKVANTLEGFIDLEHKQAYYLLSAWSIGTYFAWAFSAFPYLHLYGPKESGKSKTLEALRCLTFCGWKGRDLTTAALGDTVEGLRGTILLDQAEKLSEGLVGLLADGYKRSGGKRRVVEMTPHGRSVQEFSTYGPKAFASTKDLDPDLRDRCIRVPMIRTSRKLPDLEGWEPIWAEIRDMIFRFLLIKWTAIRSAYNKISGDGSRNTELWRPIQAVLEGLAVDPEIIRETKEYFGKGTETTRHELTEWEERLFDVLVHRAELPGSPTFEMTTNEILSAMAIEGERKPGPQWVGTELTLFSLKQDSGRPNKGHGKKRETIYTFNRDHVLSLAKKYFRNTPENNVSTCPQAEFINNYNEMEVTHIEITDTSTIVHPDHNESTSDHQTDLDRPGHVQKNDKCPQQPIEIIDDFESWIQGQMDLVGVPKKLLGNGPIDLTGEIVV